jgi:NAD(P)-dependent dehydrogenase (short-subunit alcohol dehydrogenase family)
MKIHLITGANRGIGLELCKQLTEQHQNVIAVCRTPSPELKALNVQIEADIDVSKTQDIDTLAKRLQNMPIDILINNAGIMRNESVQHMDFDQIREQMEVNALAPLNISLALLPNLNSGSKIIFITSRMGSLGDNTSGSRYGYRMSKAALNMAAISLAHDLKEQEISVGIFHPGMVGTDMTQHQGIPPAESVRLLLQRIQEVNIGTSGQFRHANGETLPW